MLSISNYSVPYSTQVARRVREREANYGAREESTLTYADSPSARSCQRLRPAALDRVLFLLR